MAQYDAICIEAFNAGNPADAAKLIKKTIREPGQGEVLVQMQYAGVNPSDVFSLMGVYPGFTKVPGVLGFDGMGSVSKVGPGVTAYQAGQRVTSLGWLATKEGDGSWQQYVTLPQEQLVPLPDNISDEAGAQFYINGTTVVGLLEVSGVKAGEHLLITAAGSTLGRMLIGAAKAEGIKTIGVVRRPEAVQELQDTTGCDEVICSSTESLAARVKAITGGDGAASVVDCVGGDLSEQLGAAVRAGGTVWLYGLMEGLSFKGSGVECLFRDVSYRGFWFFPWLNSKTPEARQAVVDKTLKLIADGIMAPPVGKIFPLQEAAAAVKESQVTGRVGKVLLKCS